MLKIEQILTNTFLYHMAQDLFASKDLFTLKFETVKVEAFALSSSGLTTKKYDFRLFVVDSQCDQKRQSYCHCHSIFVTQH